MSYSAINVSKRKKCKKSNPFKLDLEPRWCCWGHSHLAFMPCYTTMPLLCPATTACPCQICFASLLSPRYWTLWKGISWRYIWQRFANNLFDTRLYQNEEWQTQKSFARSIPIIVQKSVQKGVQKRWHKKWSKSDLKEVEGVWNWFKISLVLPTSLNAIITAWTLIIITESEFIEFTVSTDFD